MAMAKSGEAQVIVCVLTGRCGAMQVGTDATDAALAAALAPDRGGFMCLAALNLCDCRRVRKYSGSKSSRAHACSKPLAILS